MPEEEKVQKQVSRKRMTQEDKAELDDLRKRLRKLKIRKMKR